MHRAEALPGAVDARQRFARCVGGVPGLRRFNAVVTIAAGCAGLAEVIQQAHAAAARAFTQAEQRIQLGEQHALEGFAAFGHIDHATLLHHVAQAVRHPRIGGRAVASRAAGFLIVAFDALG